MGCKLRKIRGSWYLVIDHKGQRKTKAIGSSRAIAEEVRREVERRLAGNDFGIFEKDSCSHLTFKDYAQKWLAQCATLGCKDSTVYGYAGVLNLYVFPVFGTRKLVEIRRGRHSGSG
jgi:Phage integrase, N-terminal SAM-like domain